MQSIPNITNAPKTNFIKPPSTNAVYKFTFEESGKKMKCALSDANIGTWLYSSLYYNNKTVHIDFKSCEPRLQRIVEGVLSTIKDKPKLVTVSYKREPYWGFKG